MEEDSPHFRIHLFFRPVGMLLPQPGSLHLARRPVELFRECEAALRSHAAEDLDLLGAGLFIRQHGNNMGAPNYPGKARRAGKPALRWQL